jgi:hypothetical protein
MQEIPNQCLFLPKKEAEALLAKRREGVIVYNASSYGEHKFLSPFNFNTEFNIPVPGQPGLHSHSVEAIWQGLKIIDGKTDFEMFSQLPRKRPSHKKRRSREYRYEDTQFLLRNEPVDLVTARHEIYVPAYTFMFNNYIPKKFKEEVVSQLEEGIEVYFHDVTNNGEIDNPHKSYAHSALLADLINKYAQTVEFDINRVMEVHNLEEVLDFLDCPEAPKGGINREQLKQEFYLTSAYFTYLRKQVQIMLGLEYSLPKDVSRHISFANGVGGEMRDDYELPEGDVFVYAVLREKVYSAANPVQSKLIEKRFYAEVPYGSKAHELLRSFRKNIEKTSI